jgi:hypothetical protein
MRGRWPRSICVRGRPHTPYLAVAGAPLAPALSAFRVWAATARRTSPLTAITLVPVRLGLTRCIALAHLALAIPRRRRALARGIILKDEVVPTPMTPYRVSLHRLRVHSLCAPDILVPEAIGRDLSSTVKLEHGTFVACIQRVVNGVGDRGLSMPDNLLRRPPLFHVAIVPPDIFRLPIERLQLHACAVVTQAVQESRWRDRRCLEARELQGRVLAPEHGRLFEGGWHSSRLGVNRIVNEPAQFFAGA